MIGSSRPSIILIKASGAWQGRRETDQTRLADGTSLD